MSERNNLYLDDLYFQREFVWSNDQSSLLIDSVYDGVPIATSYCGEAF